MFIRIYGHGYKLVRFANVKHIKWFEIRDRVRVSFENPRDYKHPEYFVHKDDEKILLNMLSYPHKLTKDDILLKE